MTSDANSFETVVEMVMAGNPANEVAHGLKVLPNHDRQALLCTVCSLQNEIARNCEEHGREVRMLLESQCPLFVDGVATCLSEEHDFRP